MPVFYTLRYLSNGRFATTQHAVNYSKRACAYQQGPGPLQGTSFFVDNHHDKITVSQTWIGDANQVQFALQAASSITWWKALEVGDRKTFVETQDTDRGPNKSPTYSLSDFGAGSTLPLSFWKAKGLGVHTYLETKTFNKSDLGGYLTTFYWNND